MTPLIDDASLHILVDGSPDAMLVVDREGRILYASRQSLALFGYKPEELVGRSVHELVPDSVRDRHHALMAGYYENPSPRPMGLGLNLMARRRDGSLLPVMISLNLQEIKGVACTVAIVRDVTELRRLEAQKEAFVTSLKRSNEELERFAYVASHDLQEPLRVVTGYCQLIKRRYQDRLDQEANEFIDFAVDGAKRMQELIQDLLAYSRVTSRGRPFTQVNLEAVLEHVRQNLDVAITETGAVISADPLPTLPGDQSQLGQLLQNLLSNALKFRRADTTPRIRITAREAGGTWVLAVEDNGIGIEPEQRQRIFEVFHRLHGRDRYPGTGIGLAICKKVVERHGGTINVRSAGGGGSVFEFSLPASAERSSDESRIMPTN